MQEADKPATGSQDDWAEHTLVQRMPAQDRRVQERQQWVHFLVYRDPQEPPDAPPQRVPIGAVPVRVGRRAPCEVVLRDTEVSAQHCELRLRGAAVVVTDLKSTNGTFVDGRRVDDHARLRNGSTLQVGRHFMQIELREQHELAQSEQISRDLERASRYVQSLLPAPLHAGPLQVDWCFRPSAKVGGDGFGYFAIDEHTVVGYMIDVSGHGVGAAMHLVSVMSALRQRALPGAEFRDPASVLSCLNAMFPMDSHDGMLFSIWYGVADLRRHRLRFASAGHHPGYLLPADGGPSRALHTRNPVIGAVPWESFQAESTTFDPGDRLYLFSDGVFEITTREGQLWSLDQFVPLLGRPHDPSVSEPDHLFATVRRLAQAGPLDDDFSLLAVKML